MVFPMGWFGVVDSIVSKNCRVDLSMGWGLGARAFVRKSLSALSNARFGIVGWAGSFSGVSGMAWGLVL